MLICLNGKLVPQEQALVSVLDRGFLYGDGLLEAIRISQGRLFRWEQHFERLQRGADFLRLRLPFSGHDLNRFALQLIEENQTVEGVLRIVLSRGVGLRGYSPRGANQPTVILSSHPLPDLSSGLKRWKLQTTGYHVYAGDPLSQFKTCNKLSQVLARAEAEEAGADEGLLLTPDGMIAEATSGNIFWVQHERIVTPPLQNGVLPGITRAVVRELCQTSGIPTDESLISPEDLQHADGAFISLTTLGIVEVSHLDGKPLASSTLTTRLHTAYEELLRHETGARA